MDNEYLPKIGSWLKSGKTGASSLALCAALLGDSTLPLPWPGDVDDFSRCYEFLHLLTEEDRKETLLKISENSIRWGNLKDKWGELENIYLTGHIEEFNKLLRSLTV